SFLSLRAPGARGGVSAFIASSTAVAGNRRPVPPGRFAPAVHREGVVRRRASLYTCGCPPEAGSCANDVPDRRLSANFDCLSARDDRRSRGGDRRLAGTITHLRKVFTVGSECSRYLRQIIRSRRK